MTLLNFENWLILNKDSINQLYNQLNCLEIFNKNKINISDFEYFCYCNSTKNKYKYI